MLALPRIAITKIDPCSLVTRVKVEALTVPPTEGTVQVCVELAESFVETPVAGGSYTDCEPWKAVDISCASASELDHY